MNKTDQCKWINFCPLRRFERNGQLDLSWKTKYCESNWNQCIRYQMEERGENHPDYMLPDGRLDKDLDTDNMVQ